MTTYGTCQSHPDVHAFQNDPDPCIGWVDARIEKLREILTSMRDDAVIIMVDPLAEEIDEVAAQSTLDAYHGVARIFDLLDEETSASRQHFIDTGAYLLHGEAIHSAGDCRDMSCSEHGVAAVNKQVSDFYASTQR
jgi:hypothetical protein